MSEDTGLRLELVRELMRMGRGTNWSLEGKLARQAWPATGSYDRSIENEFLSIALAADGHRPMSSYTTEQRIRRDLDDTFMMRFDEREDVYYIRRLQNPPPRSDSRPRALPAYWW